MKIYPKSCVKPDGQFIAAIHNPSYTVINNRLNREIITLGKTRDGEIITNDVNFPEGDLQIENAQPIIEIPNAFPFWGTTYILANIAEQKAGSKNVLSFSPAGTTSFNDWPDLAKIDLKSVPRPILLTIAQTCTNPKILERLLPLCASFTKDAQGELIGLEFKKDNNGRVRPNIKDHDLYETLGNNPFLPDRYKRLMLLNPGVQGTSPIVGEYLDGQRCHIWEYLRANSYIPWGHYASNMAQDSIRYSVKELSEDDIKGLRHLYYQRIYCQLAQILGINKLQKGLLTADQLEELRNLVLKKINELEDLPFSANLWGWNYGYDFSGSGFRLHASHQQIHQQFALIPKEVQSISDPKVFLQSYAIGDQVADFIKVYEQCYGVSFFHALLSAISQNERLDRKGDLPSTLIIYEDDQVVLFVPKAQRSQGELQLMCKKEVGNIIEADLSTRDSLDRGILYAVKALSNLGARMITCIEVSKRYNANLDQRLFYCFLPKHPQSPGAFSEQQGRWITGHFPEDFAYSCSEALFGSKRL